MLYLLGGFAAGVLHVISGPDHLAAVAPLSIDRRRRAWSIGLRWGLGHALGALALGGAALMLRGTLPIDLASVWSERLVGALLVGMGLWGLRKALSRLVHEHPHRHGERSHTHVHVHRAGTRHRHAHAAFALGTLHGAAGTSHLFGVIPALALPSNAAALGWLSGFGLGSIAAMTMFAWGIGAVSRRLSFEGLWPQRAALGAASAAAVAIGLVWVFA